MVSNSSNLLSHGWFQLDRELIIKSIFMISLLLASIQLSYQWTRMIHIISGFVWYAMLIFLVVIFLPISDRFSEDTLYEIVGHIVPRIFHTVTIAGFFTVGLGWYNAIFLSNGTLSYFFGDTIDILFTISIVIVSFMYCFHLFLEGSEINVSRAVALKQISADSEEYLTLLRGIRITPRVGFIIISLAILVMFIH